MYGLTLWSVPQGFLCNRKWLLRSGSKSVRWHTQYFYCRFLHVTGKLDIMCNGLELFADITLKERLGYVFYNIGCILGKKYEYFTQIYT